jgi:hypothetical protein
MDNKPLHIDGDYSEKFREYMKEFPHGWDQYPVRIARCTHCDGLTINPQDGTCACGNELYPVSRLILPGLTYYPGRSGGDEPKDRYEGPRNIVLQQVPYRENVPESVPVTTQRSHGMDSGAKSR